MSDSIKINHCARCNELFVRIRFKVCDKCLDDEDADYRKIHDVLLNHDELGVEAVAEMAEVETACVLRMLDRGLVVNEKIAQDIKCGQPAIRATQKLCTTCLGKLDQKFFSEINQAKKTLSTKLDASVHDVLKTKRSGMPNVKKK